jgi:hypothetical protein
MTLRSAVDWLVCRRVNAQPQQGRDRVTFDVALAISVLVGISSTFAARGPDVCPCQSAYFVETHPGTSMLSDGGEILIPQGNGISIPGQCPPTRLRCLRRGYGARLRARWPAARSLACESVSVRGTPVTMFATVDGDCSTLRGVIKLGRSGQPQPFVAHRVPKPAVDPCDTANDGGACESVNPGLGQPAVQATGVIGSIQAARPEAYRFSTSGGDVVTLTMNRTENVPDGSSTLDPLLELHDSRGILIAFDDETGSNLPDGPGRNALIQDLHIPATDTYTVIARGAGGTAGPYTIQLTSTAGAELIPETFNPIPPTTPAFTFDGAILRGDQMDRFTFAANGDTVLSVAVDRVANQPDGTSSLDPAVQLRDSRGVVVRADQDSGANQPVGPGRNALIANLSLLATDTYTVVVRGRDQTTGPYHVRVTFAPLP